MRSTDYSYRSQWTRASKAIGILVLQRVQYECGAIRIGCITSSLSRVTLHPSRVVGLERGSIPLRNRWVHAKGVGSPEIFQSRNRCSSLPERVRTVTSCPVGSNSHTTPLALASTAELTIGWTTMPDQGTRIQHGCDRKWNAVALMFSALRRG